ncbi:MAG: sulfurtransferase TusA family protein [Candidatus Heimdallarchaeota archaeon]|nr:sulfurtransferase TusA family protein [Candidatus Heimdallarchaeota archaeon]
MSNNEKITIDLLVNAKGVPCPIPSMRVRLNMSKVPLGGYMKVVSEAAHSADSIPRYCHNFGHTIVFFEEKDGLYTFIIKKKGGEKGD